MSDPQPMTVEQLLSKLRGMLGHLTRRNGETVQAAIAAIFELSRRLQEATSGVVDDGAKPVTAEQIDHLLGRRRAERRTVLDAITDAGGHLQPADRMASEVLDEAAALVGGPRILVVDRETECGNRCDLHDECELACVLPIGHVAECRCAIAVRALEQRHDEVTTAARQKGSTD